MLDRILTDCSFLTEFDQEFHDNAMREEGREEGRAEGREEGREEGRAEGVVITLMKLVQTGAITLDQAIGASGLPEGAFRATAQRLGLL